MTDLQTRNAARHTVNAQRLAALLARTVTPADQVLADLRANVECIAEVCDNGEKWGQVYLANVGRGHAFAGHLSALTARGLYRPQGDQHFGLVKLA